MFFFDPGLTPTKEIIFYIQVLTKDAEVENLPFMYLKSKAGMGCFATDNMKSNSRFLSWGWVVTQITIQDWDCCERNKLRAELHLKRLP